MLDPKKIRNVIACEDIRDEIGNKKSLMGVLGGDILVAEFPATLQLAIYFEYAADESDEATFVAKFRLWQDDTAIAAGEINAPIQRGKSVTLVIPRGLVQFQKEASFRMTIALEGENELEVLRKSVSKGPTS
jgi:hypothetical protein